MCKVVGVADKVGKTCFNLDFYCFFCLFALLVVHSERVNDQLR